MEFDEGWGWGKSLSSWFRFSRCMRSAYLGLKWYYTCRHAISFDPHTNPIKKQTNKNPWNVHSKILWGSCYNPHLTDKKLRLKEVYMAYPVSWKSRLWFKESLALFYHLSLWKLNLHLNLFISQLTLRNTDWLVCRSTFVLHFPSGPLLSHFYILTMLNQLCIF